MRLILSVIKGDRKSPITSFQLNDETCNSITMFAFEALDAEPHNGRYSVYGLEAEQMKNRKQYRSRN